MGTVEQGCRDYSQDEIIASEVVLMVNDQATQEHNCFAWLGFRPDEDPAADSHALYASCGDGGPQNDPFYKGQNFWEPHGSLMRIQVHSTEALEPDEQGRLYSIPPDNMMAPDEGLEELFAVGLRNPWRCSWDSKPPHDLFCGDSSQDRVEMIYRVNGGENFGWGAWEGGICNTEVVSQETGEPACYDVPAESITLPILSGCHNYWREYVPDGQVDERDKYCPIIPNVEELENEYYETSAYIGGFIYRGEKYRDVLDGWYIYADWGTQKLFAAHPPPSGKASDRWVSTVIANLEEDAFPQISAFAQDPSGEVYIVGYSQEGKGHIYELPCGELCVGGKNGDAQISADVAVYKGCYWDNWTGDPDMTGAFKDFAGELTPQACAAYCKEEGFNYFGLQQGSQCYCSDTYGHAHRRGDQCNIPCDGNPEAICGGALSNSVYQVTPPPSYPDSELSVYLGCFGLDTDMAVQDEDGQEYVPKEWHQLTGASLQSDEMSFDMCRKYCLANDSLLFSLERGTYCYCGAEGDAYSYFGESQLCTIPCPGGGEVVTGNGPSMEGCGGKFSASIYLAVAAGTTADPTLDHVVPNQGGGDDGGAGGGPLIEDEGELPTGDEGERGGVTGEDKSGKSTSDTIKSVAIATGVLVAGLIGIAVFKLAPRCRKGPGQHPV
ncbi:unnamed protein product [Chrysoparadoxa australica]